MAVVKDKNDQLPSYREYPNYIGKRKQTSKVLNIRRYGVLFLTIQFTAILSKTVCDNGLGR